MQVLQRVITDPILVQQDMGNFLQVVCGIVLVHFEPQLVENTSTDPVDMVGLLNIVFRISSKLFYHGYY